MKTELAIRPLDFKAWQAQMMEEIDPKQCVECVNCDGWGCDVDIGGPCLSGEVQLGELSERELALVFNEEMYADALVSDLISYAMWIGESSYNILLLHGIRVQETTDQERPNILVTVGYKCVHLHRQINPGNVPKTPYGVNSWAAEG